MTLDENVPGSHHPAKLSSEPLEDIRHLKVSFDNPETSTNDGLDFERCSALHNAIVRHAWQVRGYDLADLPSTTWWQRQDYAHRLDDVQEHLPESIVEFLKRAMSPAKEELPESSEHCFFCLSDCLASPGMLWSDSQWFGVGPTEYEADDSFNSTREIDRIALYLTNTLISDETLDSIIYDYDAHWCVFNSSLYFVFEEDESSPMWQRLETILTAWIEMTERRKVAVVHKDLGNGPDPASGVYLDTQTPWGWAPWTKANLEDALDAWNDLLSAINDRFPEPHAEPLSGPCIFDVEDLRAVNIGDGSFVGEFYKKACRPFFQFLAPGLELASSEQLFDDVFRRAWETQDPHGGGRGSPDVFPLPILLGSQLAKSWVDAHQYEVGPVTWGLYLDLLHSRAQTGSYEDAARLVLPYEIDEATFARTVDGKPAIGNAELYQIGQNPFEITRKTTQMWQMLKNFIAHIEAGEWNVGAKGVDEDALVFDNFFVHGMDPDVDEAQECALHNPEEHVSRGRTPLDICVGFDASSVNVDAPFHLTIGHPLAPLRIYCGSPLSRSLCLLALVGHLTLGKTPNRAVAIRLGAKLSFLAL